MVDALAPQIDAYTDWQPTPRLGITFTQFVAGTETATVYRILEDSILPVPGGEAVGALGGLTLIDPYAPLSVGVQYSAEQFDAAGNSLGFTPAATGFLDVPDVTILQSPSDPSIYAVIEMSDTAGSDLQNPTTYQTYNIGPRRIAITDETQPLSGLDMGFFTDTLEAYRAVSEVVKNDHGLVVYRTQPPLMVPRVLYAIGTPHRLEFNLPQGLEDFEWTNDVDEVSPPASNIVAATITYYPYTVGFLTYGAFEAAYLSYLDAERNPPTDVADPNPDPTADMGFIVDGGVRLLS